MNKQAEAILDRRVKSPNYFQGRLLTATDLTAEREAHLARQGMLGQALGHGIVEGLWVAQDKTAEADKPAVKISAGFALNSNGELLSLEHDQTLALTDVIPEKDNQVEAGRFKTCKPHEFDAVASGDGFYLLVMSPVSRFEESAPVRSLQKDMAAPGCGRKWEVPGVMFYLQPFNPLNVQGMSETTRAELESLLLHIADTSDLSRLRNLMAHLCFATDEIASFVTDPWARNNGDPLLSCYGVVDYLRQLDVLSSCDVPLALMYWTGNGVEFIDCWAVRRRPVKSSLSATWPSLSADRLKAENEARLYQFQDHIDSLLRTESLPATLKADEYFRFLPAAGFLPLSTSSHIGFSHDAFFNNLPQREQLEYINGEQLRNIIDQSWQYEPIDLQEQEMVWLYRPWQQEPAIAAGETSHSYLIFTSAHMPPMNTARFDVARWDFSNY